MYSGCGTRLTLFTIALAWQALQKGRNVIMQAIRDTIYSFKAKWFDTHAQYVQHTSTPACA